MPAELFAIAAVISAVGVLLTGIASWLTYRRAIKIHEAVNHGRQEVNAIVGRVAYVIGRQEALLSVLNIDPATLGEIMRRELDTGDSGA